jgi:hypothetical protein
MTLSVDLQWNRLGPSLCLVYSTCRSFVSGRPGTATEKNCSSLSAGSARFVLAWTAPPPHVGCGNVGLGEWHRGHFADVQVCAESSPISRFIDNKVLAVCPVCLRRKPGRNLCACDRLSGSVPRCRQLRRSRRSSGAQPRADAYCARRSDRSHLLLVGSCGEDEFCGGVLGGHLLVSTREAKGCPRERRIA